MYYKSKKVSLIILFVTAIVCAGVVTFLLSDPVNRTFVVAVTMGILIYFFSLAAYLFDVSTKPTDMMNQYDTTGISILEHLSLVSFTGLKRLLFAIAVQMIIAVGFFLYWN